MNFETDAADKEFRERVQNLLAKQMEELCGSDPSLYEDQRFLDIDIRRRWTRALDEGGLLVPHWPREFGGAEWPVTWPRILEEELAAVNAPPVDTIGTGFVGPMLCKYGSSQQKRRYLPRIRNADDFWCQGFSEPGAGSDVMSLSTVATRHKNGFAVNGRKLWITAAHIADMMFTLVRVELPGGRRQEGLTFLLINMHDPAVKIRPIFLIDGTHRVNEVTLQDVQVPMEDMVGEQGKGWIYARSLLADERAIVAGLGQIRELIDDLKTILASQPCGEHTLLDSVEFRMRLARMEIELNALEFMDLRRLDNPNSPLSSVFTPILKLRGCELRQQVTELTMEALGERALEAPWDSTLGPPHRSMSPPKYIRLRTRRFLYERSSTIVGGTSEIQRNIIAAIGLGL